MESEKLVIAVVEGRLSAVKACMDRQSLPAGDYGFRVRVHRSGRVLSASIPGVNADTDRCIQDALGGLQISGMKTDTIDVQRTIRLTRP